MISRETYVKWYDDHYKGVGLIGAGTGEHEKKAQLWKEAGWNTSKLTLDYGCGFGAMARICAPDFYRGVDISEEAIRLAKQQFPNHSFYTFEIGKLVLPSVYEFIAAMSVFTHCRYEDVQDCLGDVKRAMTKDGVFLVDILEAPQRKQIDAVTCTYPLEDFLEELTKTGFEGKAVGQIAWPNGFTHTYIKCSLRAI
jgi:cyclopropane fatty-acyl-phospholipid synthase-like methyltransferase